MTTKTVICNWLRLPSRHLVQLGSICPIRYVNELPGPCYCAYQAVLHKTIPWVCFYFEYSGSRLFSIAMDAGGESDIEAWESLFAYSPTLCCILCRWLPRLKWFCHLLCRCLCAWLPAEVLVLVHFAFVMSDHCVLWLVHSSSFSNCLATENDMLG